MRTTKYIFAFLLSIVSLCSNADTWTIKGTVKQWAGDTLTVNRSGHSPKEAQKVGVDAEGNFCCTIDIDESAYGYYHKPGVYQTLIMIPGTTTIVLANGEGNTDVSFSGDLADVYAFNDRERKTMNTMLNKLVPEDAKSPYAFAYVNAMIDRYIDSAFVAVKDIRYDDYQMLFRKSVADNCTYAKINYGAGLENQASDEDYNKYMSHLRLDTSFKVGRYLHWREACEGRKKNLDYLNMLSIIGEVDMPENLRETAAIDVVQSYFSHPDSVIDKVMGMALTYIHNEKNRESIYKVYETVRNLTKGTKLKECELLAPDGSVHQFSELKGKYVFMDIWATWCAPCCAQIPYMEKLYNHFKGDPRIAIVSVSVDSKREPWIKKIEKDKPQWQQFLQPDFCKLYAIPGIPRFFFIAPDGTFVDSAAPRPSSDDIIEWIESRMK